MTLFPLDWSVSCWEYFYCDYNFWCLFIGVSFCAYNLFSSHWVTVIIIAASSFWESALSSDYCVPSSTPFLPSVRSILELSLSVCLALERHLTGLLRSETRKLALLPFEWGRRNTSMFYPSVFFSFIARIAVSAKESAFFLRNSFLEVLWKVATLKIFCGYS